MKDIKPLIQHLKESGWLSPPQPDEFYTCVREKHTIIGTSKYSGALGTALDYYGPGQWSCIKGVFDLNASYPKRNKIERKCIFIHTADENEIKTIQKELNGSEFTIFTPTST